MKMVIETQTLQEILDFLMTQPFKDAAPLVGKIQQATPFTEDGDEPKIRQVTESTG